MAENGVERVASWIRWVYFRKRASDGPFDIYSDIGSRIAHYKRIAMLWLPIMLCEIMLGFSNLSQGLDYMGMTGHEPVYQFVMGIVLLGLGAAIFFAWNSLRLKIKRLRQEKTLRE